MIVYHGTSFVQAKSIINDRSLKIHMKSFYDESPYYSSDKRFIYFTINIASAIRYARNAASQYKDKRIALFRIDIDRSELKPDNDQLKQETQSNTNIKRAFIPKVSGEYNLEKSLKLFSSCCVDRNVTADEFNIEYIVMEPLYESTNKILFSRIDEYLFLSTGREDSFSEEWNKLKQLESDLLSLYTFEKIK